MEGNAALRGQLDQELADSSPPPLGTLVADSIVDGRRLRRRRRFVTIASAAAGVLLLVGGGAVATATLRGGQAAPETAGQGGPGIMAPATPAPTESATPVPPTGLTGEEVMARLTPLLPAGGTVSDLKTSTDEYGAEVTFTFTVGGKHGGIVVGVVMGPDPARFVCHNPKDKTCKQSHTGGVLLRSLMLDKRTVRVDAGFTWNVIVFVEADTSVLSRTQAIAIAKDPGWKQPA